MMNESETDECCYKVKPAVLSLQFKQAPVAGSHVSVLPLHSQGSESPVYIFIYFLTLIKLGRDYGLELEFR